MKVETVDPNIKSGRH